MQIYFLRNSSTFVLFLYKLSISRQTYSLLGVTSYLAIYQASAKKAIKWVIRHSRVIYSSPFIFSPRYPYSPKFFSV